MRLAVSCALVLAALVFPAAQETPVLTSPLPR